MKKKRTWGERRKFGERKRKISVYFKREMKKNNNLFYSKYCALSFGHSISTVSFNFPYSLYIYYSYLISTEV
jgi:hypothetical protein